MDEAIFKETPEGFPSTRSKCVASEVVRQHHYLGFKRFAGRGLRYVVEWRGKWLASPAQSGAFKCHLDRLETRPAVVCI